jgi:hypothetical protein
MGMTRKRYGNRLVAQWQELGMRDLVADWKRWSAGERLLAMILISILIGLPLRALIASTPL